MSTPPATPLTSDPLSGGQGEVHLPAGIHLQQQIGGASGSSLARDLRAILRERLDLIDSGAEALVARLRDDTVPSMIDVIVASLDGLPPKEVEAWILSTSLDDLLGVLDDVGAMGALPPEFLEASASMRELSVRQLELIGIDDAAGLLDQEAVIATLDATQDRLGDTWWDLKVRRPMAATMLDRLHDAALLNGLDTIRARLEDHGMRWDHAVTEAWDALALFDTVVVEETAMAADPAGDTLLRAYMGPDDEITRPLCDRLVGFAFTVEQLRRTPNGHGGVVLTGRGGKRCRHAVVAVLEEVLKLLGLRRGTDAQLRKASAAASPKKGGRK